MKRQIYTSRSSQAGSNPQIQSAYLLRVLLAQVITCPRRRRHQCTKRPSSSRCLSPKHKYPKLSPVSVNAKRNRAWFLLRRKLQGHYDDRFSSYVRRRKRGPWMSLENQGQGNNYSIRPSKDDTKTHTSFPLSPFLPRSSFRKKSAHTHTLTPTPFPPPSKTSPRGRKTTRLCSSSPATLRL